MGIMFNFQKSNELCPDHSVQMLVMRGTLICPVCSKNALEESRKVDAQKQKEEWIKTRTKQAFFPRRHNDCTLKSYIVQSAPQQIALEASVQFAKDCEQNLLKNLMLVGSTGTGKTHLACGIGRFLLRINKSVRYITSAEISEKVIASWGRKDQTEESVIEDLASYDLLIIDEIGLHDSLSQEGKSKNMNDIKKQAVHKVLFKRYDDMKNTILVSNYDQSVLQDWLGDRLWSRLRENQSQLVDCVWADQRVGGGL